MLFKQKAKQSKDGLGGLFEYVCNLIPNKHDIACKQLK